MNQDAIAIRCGAGNLGWGYDAACAGLVLDHNGLAEGFLHGLRQGSGDGVGGTTGGKRYHHGDRLGGIGCGCNRCQADHAGQAESEHQVTA